MRRLVLLIALLLLPGMSVSAQDMLAPPAIPGVAVYVPFPVTITLDGDLSDWANVPTVTVETGPMLSSNPAENGSFTFAVAADADYFFITMAMPDATLITGQHEANFWNEDSLEFFLNLSGDLFATTYSAGVFQININPGDIGNTDPAAVTITGTNGAASGATAIVFATDDGWGLEAAVPLGAWFTPAHGLEIGFQTQANGASELNRDVKLIWSAADTADTSWSDPSVFGRALFFEIGSTEVPMPSASEPPAQAPAGALTFVAVNQAGYAPDAPKRAVYASEVEISAPPAWTLVDASGATAASGVGTAGMLDNASGLFVSQIDFSSFTTSGLYTLSVDGVSSPSFAVGGIAPLLARDALRYFYLNRSGIELTPEFAGEWARPAGHLTDDNVGCWAGTDADGIAWEGCDYRIDGSHGWYDAGDYGKYVVNGGISAWTLMNLYERFPAMFADGSLGIPESGNGLPDLLDETRWEMDFLLGMQVPEGQPMAGMAHHKLHDRSWSGVPVLPPTEMDNDDPVQGRFVYPPSTAATLNLAATAAQCARIWAPLDAAYADQCLTAAQRAWDAAIAHPDVFTGRTPGEGGGDYTDANVSDEFFWAAAELYATTGQQVYLDYLTRSPHFSSASAANSAMAWPDTALLGVITLATVPTDLGEEEVAAMRDRIIRSADYFRTIMATDSFRAPLRSPGDYVWGSNSGILNRAILMALAYDFTQNTRYLHATMEAMHVILGRNAVGQSFVTGYGEIAAQHPHHRFWGNSLVLGFPPPPPGALVGGPNAQPSDEAALNAGVMDFGPSRRYVDVIESYSTNEVAINWNAPLAWVAAWLNAVAGS
jgi:endoglucanase